VNGGTNEIEDEDENEDEDKEPPRSELRRGQLRTSG